MPVTVTIPVTADYREVTLALGEADYLTSICLSPDYIFGVTDEAPAKLVRINRSDFSQRSVLTFANDDEHKNGADVMHVGATVGAGIYVLFRNAPPNTLMISKVDFTTTPMTYTDWWREEDYAASFGTMTTDDVYIYALVGLFPNAYIARMKLSDQSSTVVLIPGVTFQRNLRISGSPAKLYAVGQTDPPDDGLMWVKRIDATSLAVEQSTTIDGGQTTTLPNNIGVELQPKDFIWVGSRAFTGTLKRIRKSNLSDVTTVSTAITPSTSSGCRAVEDDNPFVWALFDNGKAVRINTDLPSLEQRTYALTGGFHYRIVSGDPYLFGSFYSAPTKIARYHIPSDVASGDPVWLRQIEDGQSGFGTFPTAIATTATHHILGGRFGQPSTDFGGGSVPTTPGSSTDFFIAKYDVDNNLIWVRHFGRAGSASEIPTTLRAATITTDVFGNVIAGGNFVGTVDFGGQSLTNPNTFVPQGFVAKYSEGNVLQWVRQFGNGTTDAVEINALDVDSGGNVIFAVRFKGTGEFGNAFGGGSLSSSTASSFSIALVKLDGANGNVIWYKKYGTSAEDFPKGLAIDRDGNPVIVGTCNGTTDLGGGVSVNSGAFIARYLGTNGNYSFAKVYAKVTTLSFNAIAIDTTTPDVGQPLLFVAGSYQGDNTSFDGHVIVNPVINQGGIDRGFFVAAFTSGISHIWTNANGGQVRVDAALAIAVNPATNRLALTGRVASQLQYSGQPPVTSVGWFALCLTLDNSFKWLRVVSADSQGTGVKFLNNAHILCGGHSVGIGVNLRFGGNPEIQMTGVSSSDGFVVKYNA